MTETESTSIASADRDVATDNHNPDVATDDHNPDETEERSDATGDRGDVTGNRNVRGYLYRGALVLLVLFAIVALFQFYMSALAVIRTFVADQYRPLFNAAFNLAVLLATGIGISYVVRQLD